MKKLFVKIVFTRFSQKWGPIFFLKFSKNSCFELVPLPTYSYGLQHKKLECLHTEAEFLDIKWTKGLRVFLPCYSQSPLLTDITLPHPSWAKVVWTWFVIKTLYVYRNLKSTFKIMPSTKLYVHEFGFCSRWHGLLGRVYKVFVTYKSAGYFKCMWRKNNLAVCKTSTGAQHTIMIFRVNWQEFHRILQKHQKREQRCWQNFIISMSDITFLKGNENLRPFFEILSSFFHFWPLKFPLRFLVSSKRWKLFFFE